MCTIIFRLLTITLIIGVTTNGSVLRTPSSPQVPNPIIQEQDKNISQSTKQTQTPPPHENSDKTK